VDHVITDPPYSEVCHKSAVTTAVDKVKTGICIKGVEFDYLKDPAELAGQLVTMARRWVLAFCVAEDVGAYAKGAGKLWVRAGIWDKIRPTPQLTGDRPGTGCECIAIMHGKRSKGKMRWNGSGRPAVWRHLPPYGDDRNGHPTPKPLPLMLQLVEDFTDPGDTILDPYCGSGTTLVAALRLGRNAIGVELNPAWADTARERCEAELRGSDLRSARAGQLPMFGGTK
jgi:site-specific DNA-methyltransferase (adenine-specific)